MDISNVRDLCFGCSACYSTCPVNAITMISNQDGFLYPEINNSICIKCGKCAAICPRLTDNSLNNDYKIYAGFHKDFYVWANSTSGGAFVAICNQFGDENTFVVGAMFNSSQKEIEHLIVGGVSNASLFSGSKYVQSNLKDVFKEVKRLLAEGKKVIFSGTPCQIAGLRRFTSNIETSKLLCIGVVCNGVGSPQIFKDYLCHIERINGSIIKDYKFRDKKITCGVHRLYRRFTLFSNGKTNSSDDDLYNNCYLQKIICRKSCFHCPYNVSNIESDITIGDFKKQYIIQPASPYNRNESIIIAHTSIGKVVCSQLNKAMFIVEVDDNAIDYPSHGNKNEYIRDQFFADYKKQDNDIINLLSSYAKKRGILLKIWIIIPDKIRGLIKKMIGR